QRCCLRTRRLMGIRKAVDERNGRAPPRRLAGLPPGQRLPRRQPSPEPERANYRPAPPRPEDEQFGRWKQSGARADLDDASGPPRALARLRTNPNALRRAVLPKDRSGV